MNDRPSRLAVAPAGKRRYWIYLLLFLLAAINTADRAALSVAAKPIAEEFGISTVEMGYLFSSVLWAYLFCLIPAGMLADRFGTRAVNAGGIILWSAATALTGGAWSFHSVLASRLVMGIGEATTWPAAGRVIREWAPAGERGFAAAVFNTGSYAGPAFGALLIAWLVSVAGWRVAFFGAGAVGIVWVMAWLVWFRRPEQAAFLGAEERALILRERDAGSGDIQQARAPARIGVLLRSRSLWGACITQGCAVYTQYLFLTWLPSYLQATRNLSMASLGVYTALPYAAAVLFGILLGATSDRMLTGAGVQSGRRRNMVAGTLLLSSVVLLAPLVSDIWLILLLIAVSLSGIAAAISLNIALVSDLLRSPQDAGKATGILIVGGNAFGIAAPIVTGYVIAATGSYNGAFVIAGLLLLVGVAVSLTMTRQPIETEHPATARSADHVLRPTHDR